MGQWLEVRARYLHLLLENEGLNREPTCSMCDNPMDVKCSDCLGGNYFCRNFAIQSHQRTPFHRLTHWTGRHFAPVSSYTLGIVLFLEHDGVPCPLTVEVCIYSLHQFCSLMTFHITIRARKWPSLKFRKLGTPIPLPQRTTWSLPPHHCTILRTYRDCPQLCLSH